MPDSSTPQLAHLLSDLVSLRMCDPAAALALVSARATTTPTTSSELDKKDADADITRAKELVSLHYAVKETHRRGELGAGLAEARASVERANGKHEHGLGDFTFTGTLRNEEAMAERETCIARRRIILSCYNPRPATQRQGTKTKKHK
ncbi:hypothetical protein P171DRAFT_487390 [Karstenula rhodostoma CBS 690.94]|uniref:Uncharacterized protein n=1 Tax=Karstenula rhodostoma CBS 690.94 TaxID=1392251 RepID=A0A9P4PBU5_9PLEO|nr:hypothetical protein P171DRAFT_487390 [Karstenula rhodostoma CBS 690.94]